MAKDKVKFIDKHPLLGLILILIQSELIIMQLPSTLGGFYYYLYDQDLHKLVMIIRVLAIILAILLFIIQYLKRKPQFTGHFGDFKNPFGWKVQLFFALYWIGILIITATTGKFGISGIEAVFLAPINAGISEEIAFRALPITFAMKHRDKKNMILWSVILTALVFGGRHIFNIAGQSATMTYAQIVSAGCAGLLFSAIYLRTGNIFFSMLPHFLNDVINNLNVAAFGEGLGMVGDTLTLPLCIDLVMSIGLGIAGLYLVRPAVREQIVAVWDQKYNGK